MAITWDNFGAGGDWETTNATETFATNFQCQPDSQGYFNAICLAAKSDGTEKYWSVFGRWKRVGSGTPTIVGGLSNLLGPLGDLGAVTWGFTFVAQSDGTIECHIQGQAATTIEWTGNIVGRQVYDA